MTKISICWYTGFVFGNILDCGGVGSLFKYWLAEKGYTMKVVDFVTRDMTSLQFSDESFGVIYSVSVLEHLEPESRVRALRKMARVVEEDGVIALAFDLGGDDHNKSRRGGGRFAIGSVNEVLKDIENADLNVRGNMIDEEMDVYKERRPEKEKYEVRYQLITRRLGPIVDWKELVSYMVTLLTYKYLSPNISYVLTRDSMADNCNIFRLFWSKSRS